MESNINDRIENLHTIETHPSISQKLIREIVGCLKTRCRGYLPGISVGPLQAIALYENTVNTVVRIYHAHRTKTGDDNNNPNNFGNVYEEQEVAAYNREQIIQGTDLRAERTDNLYELMKNDELPNSSLTSYANKHDEHTDVVYYHQMTGEVIQTSQLKHTRNSQILTKEAYSTSDEAPQNIIVPQDVSERHKIRLQKISENGKTENCRFSASVAKSKLKKGLIDSKWTENPDKDNHPTLHKFVLKNPRVAQAIPYLKEGTTMVTDAGQRIGNKLIMECIPIIMGGVLFELKDAVQNNSINFLNRLKRFVFTVLYKIKSLVINSGPKEICFEITNCILGIFTRMFSTLKLIIKTLGNGLRKIWDKIWDFVTGKIKSFHDLLTLVMKDLCECGILSFSLAVEQYLSVHFPFVPRILISIFSEAIARIAIITVNSGIETVIGTIVEIFAESECARQHREMVKSFIDANLQSILNDSVNIEQYAQKYLDNKKILYSRSFEEIRNSFHIDTHNFIYKTNELTKVFGAQPLNASYADDLEKELIDFARKKHKK